MTTPVTGQAEQAVRRQGHDVDFLFLLLLIMVLPVQESPKFVFWLLFVSTATWRCISDRCLLANWDWHDSLIVSWMLSGFIVALFAGIDHKQWSGATDLVVFTSVLLLLKKRTYDHDRLLIVLRTILISTVVAALLALWKLYVLDENSAIEFHSVGHVNHTALYLCLSIAVVLALLVGRWPALAWPTRLLLLSVYTLFAYVMSATESRAAIFATLLLIGMCFVTWRRQRGLSLALLSIFIFCNIAIYLVGRDGVVEKQISQLERGIFLAARQDIWRVAMLTWRHNKLFGVGIKNYGQVDSQRVQEWLQADGQPYVADDYLPYPHGHSLYLNSLAERGLIGSAVVMLNLLLLGYLLLRYRPPRDQRDYRVFWFAASGALLVNLVVGLFNTSLHHEHALLSMIMLGCWLGYLRQKAGTGA
jgi:O-antigen ligase